MNLKRDHKSLEEKAYDAVKNMILLGELKPNIRLIEDKMARDLGVSRTTIKKAFIKLKEEGLVEGSSWQSIHVRLMEKGEVLEAYMVREVLEGLSARMAAHSLDDKKIDQMIETFKKFESDEHEIDAYAYAEADFNLHKMIADSYKNKLIPKLILALMVQIRSYQRGVIRSPRDSLKEHMDILYALKKRDENLSEEMMRKHIRNIGSILLNIFQSSQNGKIR